MHRNWRWGWHNHSCNWWGWASAGAITGWVVGSIGQPVYYDYGVNCYYEGDNVYYEGEVVATAAEYAQQAQQIAAAIPPDVEAEKVEWLPLGVFAMTEKDGDAEDSSLFVQLAISKEGVIAGSFQNTATDEAFEVEGTIDKKSQRAAWGPVGKEWPIMETAIYNLSENEAGALVHFENGETQQWTLVRLDEPEASGNQ